MKKYASLAAKARTHLDPRLNEVREARSKMARPNQGWIRAIRQALGMTTRQLAQRMGIAQGTLTGLEVSEMNGSIRLDTLRKAAEAMNCSLVYAFVPKAPLEEIVQEQARKVAAKQLSPVEHSMLLENQALDSQARETFLKNYIQNDLDLTKIWQ
jgi:predicted DNA-binding mobile mystery protein A